MTHRRILTMAFIFMLAASILPAGAARAAGTDEIKNYTIDILPQADGSLMDTYVVNWCVISNSAGPLLWFTVGMPNDQYQVVSFSGDAASVAPNNEGFDYKVRIDLTRQVNAGDCVNVSVQIHQYGLANLDQTSNQIGFQFTPGWFNDVPVDHLQVTWHLPADPTQLKSLTPKPASQNGSQAVWESALQPGDKFPISVVYDKAAFPDFNPAQTALPGSSGSNPQGAIPPTAVSGAPGDSGVTVPLAPVALPAFTLANCICGCIILIVVLIVLIGFLRLIGSAARSYRGGGFLGGYPRGGGWLGGGGFGSGGGGGGGGGSIFSRTGGGSGSFGGRGMSCACVSSGCACACAGGGRAGCSRKGFDVSNLFKDGQATDPA